MLSSSIKNNRRIAILLSTFNGDKFLREQMESLLAQTYVDWTLYVRDDSSQDATLSILHHYADKYDNIVLLEDKKKLGARDSFMFLLNSISSEYYMFCDQDDVWLPNKIELSVRAISKQEEDTPNVPIVIHSDLTVVDERLNVIDSSFWQMSRINVELLKAFNYASAHCLATGCTMLINQKAKELAFPISKKAIMHDLWITLRVLQAGGCVVSLPVKTILYRQHQANVVGARDLKHNFLLNKLKGLGCVLTTNYRYFSMLSSMNYGSLMKYIYYKFMYNIKYKK